MEVSKSQLSVLANNICETDDLEFIDLYKNVNSIADLKDEQLFLVKLLKTKGFEIMNWGSINWSNGPRILKFYKLKKPSHSKRWFCI